MKQHEQGQEESQTYNQTIAHQFDIMLYIKLYLIVCLSFPSWTSGVRSSSPAPLPPAKANKVYGRDSHTKPASHKGRIWTG